MITKALMDIQELAIYLNIKKRTIYNYVQKGEIPHYRIGNKTIRFDYSKINKWLETMENLK